MSALTEVEYAELETAVGWDRVTGECRWLEDQPGGRKPRKAGELATVPHSAGYLSIYWKGRHYLAHVFALFIMTRKVHKLCDHEDGNRTHNSWINLRPGDEVNRYNRKIASNNTSGFTGVHRTRSGKWRATIKVDYKSIWGPCRLTQEEAIEDRKRMNADLAQGILKQNLPDTGDGTRRVTKKRGRPQGRIRS